MDALHAPTLCCKPLLPFTFTLFFQLKLTALFEGDTGQVLHLRPK